MKFGKYLIKEQVEEWSRYYISYKALKRLLKSLLAVDNQTSEQEKSASSQEKLDADFFCALGVDVEKCLSFLNFKVSSFEEKLKRLHVSHFGSKEQLVDTTTIDVPIGYPDLSGNEKAEDLVSILETLAQIKGHMTKLVRFSNLNAEAARKIIKKYKKLLKKQDHKLEQEESILFRFTSFSSRIAVLLEGLDSATSSITDAISQSNLSVPDSTSSLFKSAFHQHEKIFENYKKIVGVDFEVSVTGAIKENDIVSLEKLLHPVKEFLSMHTEISTELEPQKILYLMKRTVLKLLNNWFKEACFIGSTDCISVLKDHGADINCTTRFSDKNILHKMMELTNADNEQIAITIQYLLSLHADPCWRDSYGRLPIHYAAIKGDLPSFHVLMRDRPDTLIALDYDKTSPVAYAVSHQRLNILTSLKDKYGQNADIWADMHNFLFDACERGNNESLIFLIALGGNVNGLNTHGETPLHAAVRHHHESCVLQLISCGANVNIGETYQRRTPLFYAVIDGDLALVKILVSAGADVQWKDGSHWTIYQHSLFRGHNEISNFLKPYQHKFDRSGPSVSIGKILTLNDHPESTKKEYGHKYLHLQGAIQIYPGLCLDGTSTHFLQLNEKINIPSTYLSLKISVSEPLFGGPYFFEDPLSDNRVDSYEPLEFHFSCENPDERPIFKDNHIVWVQLYSNRSALPQLVAIGSILMSSFNVYPFNSGHELNRIMSSAFVSVPLLSSKTFDLVGKASILILTVLPFMTKSMFESPAIYWKDLTTKVIGHRGFGANRPLPTPQVGENTILSFVTAASLGAEYVEFDVQVTKDRIPVLHHDFIVSEEGLSVSLSSLYLSEFLKIRSAYNSKPSYVQDDIEHRRRVEPSRQFLSRSSYGSSSLSLSSEKGDLKPPKFLSNIIQAPFTTLTEALKKVPSNIGFNIEIKYPSLEERRKFDVEFILDENDYVDSILRCVYDNVVKRSIIFSSFNPHICILLVLKQQHFPVFFLTEAGLSKTVDPRCKSLQEAIRFSKRFSLFGIVTESTPLIEEPNLITAIKSTGLTLFTYGAKNNIVENARIQKEMGIDAVIVDNIVHIRKGLAAS